jgi:hypothetical protein
MQPDANSPTPAVFQTGWFVEGPLTQAALPAAYALWLIAVVCTDGLAAHLVEKC